MAAQNESSPMYGGSGELHPFAYIGAIAISIVLHVILAFFAGDAKIYFLGASSGMTSEQKLKLRAESSFKVEMAKEDPAEPVVDLPIPKADPFEVDLEEVMLNTPSDTPGALFEPPPSPADLDPGLGVELKAPSVVEDVVPEIPWQPREEIIAISDQIVFADEVPYERVDIPEIDRQMFAPDVVGPYEFGKAIRSSPVAGTPAYVNPAPPKLDYSKFAESLIGGDMRMPDAVEAGPVASGQEATAFLREIPADVAPAVPIENVLKTTVKVHRPRRGDYEYFQADIERKGENVLPPLPRDVLLVQDASASLSETRLRFCREAFITVVDNLKPEDRLNVMTFNTRNELCFSNGWQRADSATKEQAKRFIRAMRTEGNTDFYNAMLGVLDLPRDPNRVLLVIVASDGKPTAGDIQRDSEIIGQFSKLNGGRVSVFGVGVSRGSNEFLLSMLSFCNRGGAASVADDRFSIVDTIGNVYGSIGSPVLADISFLFDSTSNAEVAPEMTTHLYLDRPMRLYGRVAKGTTELVFQARGEAMGKKYDMVFQLDLEKAEVADKTLIEKWATARMYDLVAKFARTQNSLLLDSMDKLGREYDITIPFKKRLF